MKAWLLRKPAPLASDPLELVDLPLPDIGPEELLIRVTACAVCRTDIHLIEGDLSGATLPVVPGHQVVGRVVASGPGAERFAAGARLGISWLRGVCGACVACGTGRENLCPAKRFTGFHEHGGYAEFAVVHQHFAYPIPAELSDTEAAPLLCAGIIGWRALERSNLPKGGSLGIFGFGSSAHLTFQAAQARGARILVSTRSEAQQHFAQRLGAVWAGNASDRLPEDLDSALIFAPSGNVVPTALRSLKPGGTAVIAGIHLSDLPPLSYAECLFHEKDLRSVEANTREDGRNFIAFARTTGIRPTLTLWPFEEAPAALRSAKESGVPGANVLVVP